MSRNNDSRYFVLVLKHYAQRLEKTHEFISKETGISRVHVGRIFNLRYSPRADMLFAIAKSLGLDIVLQDREGGKELLNAAKDAEKQLKTMSNEEI